MKRTILVLLFIICTVNVLALPPLPTEFYGNITTRGDPAAVGGVISVSTANASCASFTMVNVGAFGLLTCPGNDTETAATEGVAAGTEIAFLYNGQPTAFISGDNTTAAGTFKYVLLSHPIPACGDGFCDPYFESNATCSVDCNQGNGTGNATNTTTTGTESGGGGGGGGSGGGGGGGSGGGGGGGAAASSSSSSSSSLPGIVSALAGLTGVTAPFGCTEEWLCTAWTNCTIEGLQQRDCEDQNFCGTQNSKPHEVQSCEYTPTCFDEILNGEETDVDCGGSKCEVCPGCNNGIKDPDEEGVDCGGSCRPCDSCYDGEQNYGESGVDCGGPCPACTEAGVAILEYPKILCEKPLNPLRNDAKWFLLLVLILLLARVYLYKKELKWIKEDQLLDEFKRARYYADRRREMWLFILVTIVVTLLSYLYYYEFLLCAIGYKYLWAFLLVLVLVPIVVYYLLRAITYSDTRKLARLQAEEKTHETVLHELMIFENNQIMEIEQDIAHMIEGVGTNVALVTELQKFPELKAIYQDIVRLHDEYHTSKTPTGIEKDLCDQVYAIETNEHFERLADEYPEITVIYQKLALLYHHYEAKQQLYDELASLKKQTREKFSDEVKPPAVEGDDDPDLDDQFSGDPEEDS